MKIVIAQQNCIMELETSNNVVQYRSGNFEIPKLANPGLFQAARDLGIRSLSFIFGKIEIQYI